MLKQKILYHTLSYYNKIINKYIFKYITSCIKRSFKRRSAFAVRTLLGTFWIRGIEVRELSRLLQGNEHVFSRIYAINFIFKKYRDNTKLVFRFALQIVTKVCSEYICIISI